MSGTQRIALSAALVLGALGDWLLRAPGPPALNVALLGAAAGAAVLLLRGVRGLLGWNGALLWAALLFSTGIAGRDAEALRALNLASALAAFLLAAGAGAWFARAGISEYVRTGLAGVLALVVGPARVLPEATRTVRPNRHVLAALRGVLLAAPLLFLFGGLLAAADPVFEQLVGNAFAFDPAVVMGHVALVCVLSWSSAGYLGRWLEATSSPHVPLRLPRPRIGAAEGTIVLALLNALFLSFVLVQLRYLFGGAELVGVTPGLTYAEYARRGFFELVGVAALVVPLLLLADWSFTRERAVEQWVFRGLALGQVLLLFAILASAFYRMRLYRDGYGLTEQRLFTTWFMGWLAFVLAWFAATVLQGRRHRFALGALASALATLLALNIANPHATIARVNAARRPFDAAYAARLSGDAVPALLASLDTLPPAERCRLADALLERWLPAGPRDWRTFNFGAWRARRIVHGERARLEALRCPASTALAIPRGPMYNAAMYNAAMYTRA